MKKTGKQNIRWNTMKILAVGFLSVIFLGAVLLWLPVSNEKSISFLDALFTSTSSVCVTGLVTIVPKYQFTITGKVILLILIQIGGLGVIACITAFFMLLNQRLLWSLLLLSVGAAAGFGLGIFCDAEPPVGCRESDLTPVPDESFVSPASASSVETSPEPEPMPEKCAG